MPWLDYKTMKSLPRHETRPRLKPSRPRQGQDSDPQDQDQGTDKLPQACLEARPWSE